MEIPAIWIKDTSGTNLFSLQGQVTIGDNTGFMLTISGINLLKIVQEWVASQTNSETA